MKKLAGSANFSSQSLRSSTFFLGSKVKMKTKRMKRERLGIKSVLSNEISIK
jgi:hypothetical protein